MLYLRLLLIVLWLPVPFGIGFLVSLFRWGNTSINRFVSGLFAAPLLPLLGIRVEVENLADLEKHQPCIYVANHQGALDILTFGSFYPRRTIVIAKKEIVYIPVLNLFFIAAGNVLVNRKKRTSAVTSLTKAVKAAKKRGASIWIFPEGTRNRSQEILLPFKKGAFHMAIAAQVPVVPVVSCRIQPILDWERRKLTGGTVRMKVLAPVETRGLTVTDVDRLSDQVHGVMVEAIRGLST